jgi:glycosyltransferase involved in cell wall biosynthesis
MNNEILKQIAVVVIGRNEGQRLLSCFESFLNKTNNIIYVDSGSTDGSVSAAKNLGIEVVNLDMSVPFTAARARNVGLNKALAIYPNIKYIQFIDGDCQIFDNWFNEAVAFIEKNSEVGVVCGRRKEIFPEHSVYNMLCDIEWNTPVGEAKACGGDALMRTKALQAVNGYREDLIAGEEPELCVRLRNAGWKIWRIDEDMTKHDANITEFKQWWKRSVRAGYAFAEGATLHGAPPEFHWVAESRRGWVWAGFIPTIILICIILKPSLGLYGLLIYPIQIVRMTIKSHLSFKKALLHSLFLMLGKFPELVGQLKYYWNRIRKQRSRLIEYK